jgi:hypothetical protein
MNITQYFEKANPGIKRKVKSGVFVPIIHTGKKEEGSTTIRQKVDNDGDPLVRFVPKDLLATYEEFGWRKAAIPKAPVADNQEEQVPGDEDLAKRGRKKA